jgi:Rrf2 family transcriptional regulator, cysteine metabolism repressor
MNIPSKTRCGLRILLQLAVEGSGGKAVKGWAIAKRQNISEVYLQQLMLVLRKHDLVKATRGCHGGYILNALPEELSILDVMEAFEGKINFSDPEAETGSIAGSVYANTVAAWESLSKQFMGEANRLTLKEIINISKNKQEYVI